MASTYELIVEAVDRTRRPIQGIERNLDRLDRRARTVQSTLRAAGGALAAFATSQAIRGIVNTTARFEDLRDTLNSVSGSAEAGGRAFEFIQDFSTRTQFGIDELTQTFIKLQGAGISPTESLLTTFTDTAAVTTDQIGTLNALADLFSRTVSGGLGLEELNRLADRGVPVFRILEEQLGLTRLEVSEFGKTAEGAERIRNALQQGLNASFGGATQGKLDNLSTAMSNFGIQVQIAASQIGEEFKPQLIEALNVATEFIKENELLLRSIGQGLGGAIEAASVSVQFLVENFNLLKAAFYTALGGAALNQVTLFFNQLFKSGRRGQTLGVGLGNAFKNLGRNIFKIVPFVGTLITKMGGLVRFVPILSSIVALAGRFAGPLGVAITVVTGLVAVFERFKDVSFEVGGITTNLGEVVNAVWWKIKDTFGQVVDFIGNAWNNVTDYISRVWQNNKESVIGAATAITNAYKGFFNFFINGWSAIGETVVDFFMNIGSNARLAFNGLVNRMASWVASFGGYVETVRGLWARLIKFMVDKFVDFSRETGTILNRAAELLGLDPIIDTAGIEAWASSFDAAIVRSDNRARELFQNAEAYAQTASENLSQIDFIPNIDFGEIFSRDPIGDFASWLTEGGGAGIASVVEQYRAYQAEVQAAADAQQRLANLEAIAAQSRSAFMDMNSQFTQDLANRGQAVSELEQAYIDLINTANGTIASEQQQQALLRLLIADLREGTINQQQYNTALRELGITTGTTVTEVQTYDQFLRQLIDTSRAEVQQTNFAIMAKAALHEQLRTGSINIDTYAEAMQRLNNILNETEEGGGGGGGVGGAARKLQTFNQFMEDLTFRSQDAANRTQYYQRAVNELTRALEAGTISQEAFDIAMEEVSRSLDSTSEKALTTAEIIQEGFKEATSSLSKDLATALRTGESVFGALENVVNRALDNILQAIIEKNITQPLIDQLSQLGGGGGGFLGGLFGGGGGGFLGGLFGGGGGGFLGGIGSFLGFANGGVPPVNRPSIVGEKGPELFVPTTTGRVIPNDELGGGSEPLTVNFNINAVSTKDGVEFLLENKPTIISLVQQASNSRGKAGILD